MSLDSGVCFLQMLFVDQEPWLTRFVGVARYTGVCGFAGCGYQKGDRGNGVTCVGCWAGVWMECIIPLDFESLWCWEGLELLYILL